IMFLPMAGDVASLHGSSYTIFRLLGMAGGYTTWWGATSFHGGMFASYFSYGTMYASNTRDDLLNSRLILMWGWNPAVTITGTNSAWYLAQARENGTRIVAIDPSYSDSAATFADQWIPIRPGTDTALAIAMAYVMIEENLADQAFLQRYTLGFDQFRDYVLGKEDGIPKTPRWAAEITGVPAATIETLAREYAGTRPAALLSGIAPGRTAFGEQFHRATIALAAMTGNVGIHGGDAGARSWESIAGGYPYGKGGIGMGVPYTPNPIEAPPRYGLWLHEGHPKVHFTKVADAILQGKAGGYPTDYKLVFLSNCDYVNSLPNVNKIARAMKTVDFIVTEEQFMTATARYADIILPTTTYMERNDIAVGVGTAFLGFQNKAIEPLGECRSHYEIAIDLAARLGIEGYAAGSEDERLQEVAAVARIPDYQAFKEKGLYRIPRTEPYVAFQAQIADPENHPFETPSGKIEIYSQQIADMGNPLIPPIPKYIEAWEGPNDPLARKYPLQIITNHAKCRTNGQFDNIPWLRELAPQAVAINAADAAARGIADGDLVRVFNDRGETWVPAAVTERLLPGVAILPMGAWYRPDENGIDRAGSANVLTRDEPTPAGSFAYNSVLAQIEKI
ncbi:MAG: molybdopterin-dependent oxidoreductase, partial [Desulfuromonadales bacterium]|nr:molybdopterin-dependent oxidoreductase [Desulfuromonadales bacterium]